MAGRPTKYTPERVQEIMQALSVGATRRLACQFGGIVEETFSVWMRTKPEFRNAVEKAEGRAAVTWLNVIEQAAASQWTAAAWKLERRYPREYGRSVTEVKDATERPALVVTPLSYDDFARTFTSLIFTRQGRDAHGLESGAIEGEAESLDSPGADG